ncbi:hypothetical protein TrST_g8658 [Triparma strigata]|uniref:Uncharacterized protein n=2 Tax=Triparma TaxID=722752 RepID=A0A9W7EL70_9STRA|nr:hypothetical protein TrST_g8658 [Triparma strigata]
MNTGGGRVSGFGNVGGGRGPGHIHLQSKYVAPTKSGLPPDNQGGGEAPASVDSRTMDRNELCAAIVDMHSQLHDNNIQHQKLLEESKILQRMINDKHTAANITIGWQKLAVDRSFDPSRL